MTGALLRLTRLMIALRSPAQMSASSRSYPIESGRRRASLAAGVCSAGGSIAGVSVRAASRGCMPWSSMPGALLDKSVGGRRSAPVQVYCVGTGCEDLSSDLESTGAGAPES